MTIKSRKELAHLEIRREDATRLTSYASIPAAFEVRERIDLASASVGETPLRTVPVMPPYMKDYDALPNNDPSSWPTRFDISNWTFLAAFVGGQRVGGAVVVEHAGDLLGDDAPRSYALVWDIRVASDWRHRGIARALLDDVVARMRTAGAPAVAIETQDVNVPACRLYAACDFALTKVVTRAYGSTVDEAKLVWTRLL